MGKGRILHVDSSGIFSIHEFDTSTAEGKKMYFTITSNLQKKKELQISMKQRKYLQNATGVILQSFTLKLIILLLESIKHNSIDVQQFKDSI